MRLFRRQVKLEDQFAQFAELGVLRNDGVEDKDLFNFHDRAELERNPFSKLAETMGYAIERDPWTPISDRLWMCDFECIEDCGDYQAVLERLERTTGGVLALTDIRDAVDIEDGVAWVEFTRRGKKVRWDLRVDNDWLDPEILVKYDRLLKLSGTGIRLYGNFDDYGQVAFLAAFEPRQLKRFTKLTGIKLAPVR